MGTGGGIWYLTHPVLLDGDDCEGCTGTTTVDTGNTVPVLVLGSGSPYAGDILVAHMVGGKWVAQRGNGGGGGVLVTCAGGCTIPTPTLTLSWTLCSGCTCNECAWNFSPLSGTVPLTWNGNPGTSGGAAWNSGCVLIATAAFAPSCTCYSFWGASSNIYIQATMLCSLEVLANLYIGDTNACNNALQGCSIYPTSHVCGNSFLANYPSCASLLGIPTISA